MDRGRRQRHHLLDSRPHVSTLLALIASLPIRHYSSLTSSTVVLGLWILSITILAEGARSSLPLAASLLPPLVPLSPSHGKDCLLPASFWVSALVQRMLLSPSTLPRWLQLGFEVL